MPKGLTAAQYFKTDSMRNAFIVNIMKLNSMESKGYHEPISGFKGDHSRIFTLEQGEDGQWKRVSLVEKYGMDIFNTTKLTYGHKDVVNEIYDIVEQGNLFFYDRGSDVPMQYQFQEAGDGFKVMLAEVKDDPRFENIHAQRKVEAQAEPEQYKQYQESKERATTIEDFTRTNPVKTMQESRQRAHHLLSPTDTAPLSFGQEGDFTAKPMQIEKGSRFTPEEMEYIVLAASTTPEAAGRSSHPNYAGLTNEETLCQLMGAQMYEDVMVTGRYGSILTTLPVYERGREIAADLITQDMQSNSEQLTKTLMSALRTHIQACRDQPSLTTPTLLLYEKTEKLALLIDKYQLYDNYNEFKTLKQEADALGMAARICLDGEQAKQDLVDAYNNGGFASEEQRQSIVSRIEAHRYIVAQQHLGKLQRETEPEYRAISAQLNKLTKSDISPEEHMLRDGQLMAQRFQTATRRPHIQQIMDATQNGLKADRRLQDFGLLTAEGQQLLNIKDPYEMIAALRKLPLPNDNTVAKDLVADMQNKLATKMDTTTASNFWARMLREMGPGQFDPEIMEVDFGRLVVQTVAEDGYRSTQPLLDALGYKNQKDMSVRSMNDAEMMEKIRDQIALGNVFFYKRGGDVPHRISLGENGLPTMSEEITKPTPPSLWQQFAHFITFGIAYRQEFERYNQDMYFLEPDTIVKGFTRGQGEVERYNIALANNNAQKERDFFITSAQAAYWDMSAVQSRAHNVLSLDEPGTVSFTGNTADYKGVAHAIPESVKGRFSKEELDALCLAGITSPAAAQAHMDAGVGTVKGTTAEVTASILEGHVYNDILVWGRDNSERFFPLLNAGRQIAADALNAYAVGQPDQMAKLLGDAIRSTVLNGRFDRGVKSNTALASEMALRMMDMLEKDPALKDLCGIDAETLDGYKQELNGLRMIGQAYDKAGAATRRLAEAVKENRVLTEAESREIATDLLTYRYLNALQVNANDQVGMKPEIMGLKLFTTPNAKMQLDQNGKRINPLAPEEGQIPTRDYYPDAQEKRDLDYEIKTLYSDPLLPVKMLGSTQLEQIQGHVKLSNKFAELRNLTDPMALVTSLKAQDTSAKINELVAEVNSFKKQEVISKEEEYLKQLQEQAKQLQEQSKQNDELNKSAEPKVVEHSQGNVPGMS